MIVKSVGVLSCAKLCGVIYAVWGLVAGIGLFLAAASGVDLGTGGQQAPGWAAALVGPGAIIILPILYGVLGFLGGALGSWVFNKAAEAMGGLELGVE